MDAMLDCKLCAHAYSNKLDCPKMAQLHVNIPASWKRLMPCTNTHLATL